jgi:hypothetical protein
VDTNILEDHMQSFIMLGSFTNITLPDSFELLLILFIYISVGHTIFSAHIVDKV